MSQRRVSSRVKNNLVTTLGVFLLFCVVVVSGCASLTSTNPYERIKALSDITDQNVLARVAIEDNAGSVRQAALKRVTDQNVLAKVAIEDKAGSVRWTAVEVLADQNVLARVAIEDKDGPVRRAAVKRLTNQEELLRLAQQRAVWEIRQAAFQKLDGRSLALLAQEAKDPAIVLAAKIRLQQSNWEQAFADARRLNKGLGDVLGAAALVDSPQPASSTVVQACHDYIRQGDVARIPELSALLLRYGDKTLAEDYLNCGQSELAAAGREWARIRGYNVDSGPGSHRVRWGRGR